MKKRLLEFELVPDGCWKSNLHELLPSAAWDYVKKTVKNKAKGKCMICGKQTAYLDAHEKWCYDIKKGVQKLVDIIAVCKDCHSAIHICRTQLTGNIERAENHYMKVNGCTYAQMRQDMGRANDVNKERNKVSEWILDISLLKSILEEKEND